MHPLTVVFLVGLLCGMVLVYAIEAFCIMIGFIRMYKRIIPRVDAWEKSYESESANESPR